MSPRSYDNAKSIRELFEEFINASDFPCIMAKAALAKSQLQCFTATHMACPADDGGILHFLYECVDEFKRVGNGYNSAVIIFEQPVTITEAMFEDLLWQRLQALADMDAVNYGYDKRVSKDPMSGSFSFSLKEEAFYVIGLHPGSSRKARQFALPALVFNPHAQFEALKAINKYEPIKHATRKRDILCSGSVNPMLEDFGTASEALQYSGGLHDQEWKCPLDLKHFNK